MVSVMFCFISISLLLCAPVLQCAGIGSDKAVFRSEHDDAEGPVGLAHAPPLSCP